MAPELSPDRDRVLEQLVADGRFASRQAALDRAVDLLREEAETADDILEGLASIERGEGMPLEQVARELRKRYGFADDA